MKTKILMLLLFACILSACKKVKEVEEAKPKTIITSYYIWAAGQTATKNGLIVHSSDGGTNWVQLSNSTELPSTLLDICIIDKNNLIAVGKPANTKNAGIYISTNGGKNWKLSGSGVVTAVTFQAVYKYNNQNIYITGDSGNIYKTNNQGANWTKIPIANEYKNHYFLRIAAQANDKIWVAGMNNYPADSTPVLLHSSNGGSTWTRKDPINDLQISAAMQD